jgi:hypothetical protein
LNTGPAKFILKLAEDWERESSIRTNELTNRRSPTLANQSPSNDGRSVIHQVIIWSFKNVGCGFGCYFFLTTNGQQLRPCCERSSCTSGPLLLRNCRSVHRQVQFPVANKNDSRMMTRQYVTCQYPTSHSPSLLDSLCLFFSLLDLSGVV